MLTRSPFCLINSRIEGKNKINLKKINEKHLVLKNFIYLQPYLGV